MILNYKNFFMLNEGIDDVLNLYKNKKDFFDYLTKNDNQIFNRIMSLDPTSKPEKDKVGKYVKWILKQLKDGDKRLKEKLKSPTKEDDQDIYDTLNMFHKPNIKNRLKKKDIFQYKSYEELEDEINKFQFSPDEESSIEFGEIQDDVKSGNLEVFGQTDGWLIIIPKNKEMSCKYGEYGTKTKWCTANPNINAFHSYKKGNLYILLDKNNNLEPKYQFYFPSNQFMDQNDRDIDIQKFFDENIEVFNLFFPNVLKKIKKGKEIDYSILPYLPKKYLMQVFDKKDFSDFVILLNHLYSSDDNEKIENVISEIENNQDKYIAIRNNADMEISKLGFDVEQKEIFLYGIGYWEMDSLLDLEEGTISDLFSTNQYNIDDFYHKVDENDEEDLKQINSFYNNKTVELLESIYNKIGVKFNKEKDLYTLLSDIGLMKEIKEVFITEFAQQWGNEYVDAVDNLKNRLFFMTENSITIIDVDKVFFMILRKNITDCRNLYDFLKKVNNIEPISELSVEAFSQLEMEALETIPVEPIVEEINKRLDEFENNISVYGEDSIYYKIGKNNIDIRKQLDKYGLNSIGDTIENKLYKITYTGKGGNYEDGFRVILTFENKKTGKIEEFKIKPKDIGKYLDNYRLDI